MDDKKFKVTIRLSPNEREQFIKDQTNKRRITRLIQVRQQCKENAAKIREAVKQEKQRLINELAQKIEKQLEEEKNEKIRQLEEEIDNSLKSIGSAHQAARDVSESTLSQLKRQQEDEKKAKHRFKTALTKTLSEKQQKAYQEKKHILSRQAALAVERERSATVASLPPPPPDPLDDILREKVKPVVMTDTNAFTTTHYHIPECSVVRAGPEEQIDGISAAEEEDERIKEKIAAKKKSFEEAIVRAKIRGQEAIKKEQLKHEYEAMLEDLSFMQRADRRRRQEIVADIPKQVFIPPNRRIEEKAEKQTDMEHAFEKLYLENKDDLELTLDLNPIPSTPSSEDSQNASVSSADHEHQSQLSDKNEETARTQETKQEMILKKLRNRIQEQKEEHKVKVAEEITKLDSTEYSTKNTSSGKSFRSQQLERLRQRASKFADTQKDELSDGRDGFERTEKRTEDFETENKENVDVTNRKKTKYSRVQNLSPLSEYSLPGREETSHAEIHNHVPVSNTTNQIPVSMMTRNQIPFSVSTSAQIPITRATPYIPVSMTTSAQIPGTRVTPDIPVPVSRTVTAQIPIYTTSARIPVSIATTSDVCMFELGEPLSNEMNMEVNNFNENHPVSSQMSDRPMSSLDTGYFSVAKSREVQDRARECQQKVREYQERILSQQSEQSSDSNFSDWAKETEKRLKRSRELLRSSPYSPDEYLALPPTFTMSRHTEVDTSNRQTGLDTFNRPTGLDTFNRPTGLDTFNRQTGLDTFNRPTGLDTFNRPTGLDTFNRQAEVSTSDSDFNQLSDSQFNSLTTDDTDISDDFYKPRSFDLNSDLPPVVSSVPSYTPPLSTVTASHTLPAATTTSSQNLNTHSDDIFNLHLN